MSKNELKKLKKAELIKIVDKLRQNSFEDVVEKNNAKRRLQDIATLIVMVDNRRADCSTPTRQEITDKEFRKIYRLATRKNEKF